MPVSRLEARSVSRLGGCGLQHGDNSRRKDVVELNEETGLARLARLPAAFPTSPSSLLQYPNNIIVHDFFIDFSDDCVVDATLSASFGHHSRPDYVVHRLQPLSDNQHTSFLS